MCECVHVRGLHASLPSWDLHCVVTSFYIRPKNVVFWGVNNISIVGSTDLYIAR